MSDITLTSQVAPTLPVPAPKYSITIRPGTMDDIANIDKLQKKYSKNLAFLPTKALEGKIRQNEVLIAELVKSGESRVERNANDLSTLNSNLSTFAGYLIGQDRYFKRDDVGIIYHLAVDTEKQRGFIGTALLKAQFDRSAYGCKLYCCWCAQDIEANRFYESMGFVPIAFRAGSEEKQRTHIFWEKRIRENDQTTPWWFPSETKGGMMQADRLAFPIPPGLHWSDPMPLIFPKDTHKEESVKQIEDKSVRTRSAKKLKSPITGSTTRRGGLFFAPIIEEKAIKKEKPKREKKLKMKNDPKYVAAARELKDRWLDAVNENPSALQSVGKYQLTRDQVSGRPSLNDLSSRAIPLLEAA